MEYEKRVEATAGTGEEPRYRPISQYGVIGDCRTAALIGPDGSIDWCCLPHFDSPAIFCRILDADRGGYFQLAPAGAATSSMVYLQGTNILETIFQHSDGRLRLVDFMPVRKRTRPGHLMQHLSTLVMGAPQGLEAGFERATDNDVAAAHRINRFAYCLEGRVPVELKLKATFDYARQKAEVERHVIGDEALGAVLTAGGRYLVLIVRRLHTVVGNPDNAHIMLEGDDETIVIRTTLTAGQAMVAAVNYARDASEAHKILENLVDHPFDRDLDETHAYWREWAAVSNYDGTYQYAVQRSALTLKLCTFEPTGAIIAAPTTSLPEDIGGVRNWDYRYTWLRDSAFTLGALERLGYYQEARDYFHFLHDLHIKSVDAMRIMYSIRGEHDGQLKEYELTHLEGYRGSRPVRIGNGAAKQVQLDIYGEVMEASYQYLRHGGYVKKATDFKQMRDLRSLAEKITEYVFAHWQDLDAGIWEVRGDPRPFVYSRAMCWVALDRACKMATHHGLTHHVDRWGRCRDTIRQDILAHGYNRELQSFVQSYDSAIFDSSSFRLPLVEFLPWHDERITTTIQNTGEALAGAHGLIYRYRPADDGCAGSGGSVDDGLPGREGSFLACTFWLIEGLCYLGQVEEARERFEEVLKFAGPLGLFAEELDPQSGAQLGNYPQAYTHIGLINSAVVLQRAQEGTLELATEHEMQL